MKECRPACKAKCGEGSKEVICLIPVALERGAGPSPQELESEIRRSEPQIAYAMRADSCEVRGALCQTAGVVGESWAIAWVSRAIGYKASGVGHEAWTVGGEALAFGGKARAASCLSPGVSYEVRATSCLSRRAVYAIRREAYAI